jgi:hypothetical protein
MELDITAKVDDLKSKLQDMLNGFPAKKMKIRIEDGIWLKDENTLAFYNLNPNSSLAMGIKERGRKK